MNSAEANKVMEKAREEFKTLDKTKSDWTDYMKIIRKHLPPSSSHISDGAPARLRKLFSQRKEAIEYFYQKEIPLDCFEKIGEVNLKELGQNPSMRDVFTHLLKGTPECKGAELLTC